MNLISYETIARHHPALKFLDFNSVAHILKNRDIAVTQEKKKIFKGDSPADRIYFILYGLVRLTEYGKSTYYGIVQCGWPIGEE